MEKNYTPEQSTLPAPPRRKKGRGFRIFLRIFFSFIAFLIIGGLAAPKIALYIINKKMSGLPDYIGHIDNIRLDFFHSLCTVEGISMVNKDTVIPVPFLRVKEVKVAFDLDDIWHGKFRADIMADSFIVNFVKGPTKKSSQLGVDSNWINLADELMPFDVNHIEVKNGTLHYIEYGHHIDVFLNQVALNIDNLDSNTCHKTDSLPTHIFGKANAYGAPLKVDLQIAANKKVPTFIIHASLEQLPLPKVNSLLRRYAELDVEAGTFTVFADIDAHDNRIYGQARPSIKDIDFYDEKKEKKEPFFQRVKEWLIDLAVSIFENEDTHKIAAKINMEGAITNPHLSVWGVVGESLVSVFNQSIFPSVKSSVNVKNVKKDKEVQKPKKKKKKRSAP